MCSSDLGEIVVGDNSSIRGQDALGESKRKKGIKGILVLRKSLAEKSQQLESFAIVDKVLLGRKLNGTRFAERSQEKRN